MRRRLAIAVAVLAVAGPAAADDFDYASGPPSRPPALCRGDAFADIVGTREGDSLRAPPRATRLWGLGGDDRLAGSQTRASCLIGGRGDDRLLLDHGGGVAFGNAGRDLVVGSPLGDVVKPGGGLDGVSASGGDDKITVRDRAPEVVDCGEGDDIVKADRIDVLIGCESVDISGREAPRLDPQPREVGRHGRVRVRLVVPRGARAGAYRVLYVTTSDGRSCRGGPLELARLGAVRRGQRVRIVLHEPGGWCPGSGKAVIVRNPPDGLPPVGVARLSFSVR
jgi:hypothetical protein